jgi:hypothetical protein
MANNIAVKITADIVDLQTKFAVAKAEVAGLNTEFSKLACQSAQGMIDAAGSARMKDLASSLIQARTAAQGYAGELQKAGVSTGSLTRATEELSHGSIATATREFRALFDELSSGRTRMTPGTLAIIASRVFGLGPAALGAVGGIAALAGGLGYLAYKAVEASHALDQMHLDSLRAGNDFTRASLDQLTAQMAQLPKVAKDDASTIIAALSDVHLPFQGLQAAARIASEQMAQTGQKADEVGKQLAKALAPSTSATEVAKQLQGVLTQAQVDAAEAADRAGNANAILAEKLQLLTVPLDRARASVQEYTHASFMAISGLGQAAIVAPQLLNGMTPMNAILADQAHHWAENSAAIQKNIAAVKALPAAQQLAFDKGTEGIRTQIDALTQLAELNHREAEQSIEAANATLNAIVEANERAQDAYVASVRSHVEQILAESEIVIRQVREQRDAQAELAAQARNAGLAQVQAQIDAARAKQGTGVGAGADVAQTQQLIGAEIVLWHEYYDKLRALAEGDAAQRAKLNAEELQKTKELTQQSTSLQIEAANRTREAWKRAFEPLTNDLATAVVDVVKGTQTMGQAFQRMAGQIIEQGIRTMIQREAQSLLAMALNKSEAKSDAATAAAGAYKAVAPVPFIGPFIAPIAAAAVYAGALSFSAAGGYDVPAHFAPAVQLHPAEMVLPRHLADRVRNMTDDEGGGGDTHHYHVNVSALDGDSVRRFFSDRRNIDHVVSGLRDRLGPSVTGRPG